VARVLVIDGDAALRSGLGRSLTEAGHDVELAGSARAGVALARTSPPDVVLLEPHLPDGSGDDVFAALRTDVRSGRTPVIVLSERADEEARVRAFEAGADDFVSKPFSTREVLLRVRALLRRRSSVAPLDLLAIGPLAIDRAARRVTVDGRPVGLTRRELDLLLLLCDRRGRVQAREVLVAEVWGGALVEGGDGEGGRVVDSTVKRLRKKLGPAKDLVATVRGAGYRLAEPDPAPPRAL
jgi:two-component system phosphate regulon response regulator PhoB